MLNTLNQVRRKASPRDELAGGERKKKIVFWLVNLIMMYPFDIALVFE